MPRPRSAHVQAVFDKLVARLNDGFHRPGDRFLSAREVAARYAVSYQTAHRLISELEAAKRLERRESSGTFVAGRLARLSGVELWFHPRARRPGSYGAHLLALLRHALVRAGTRPIVRWAEGDVQATATRYPVIWEAPDLLERLVRERRYAALLNDRPPAGLAASLIDAVATDDFSAGVCAAQVLAEAFSRGADRPGLKPRPYGSGVASSRAAPSRVASSRVAVPCAAPAAGVRLRATRASSSWPARRRSTAAGGESRDSCHASRRRRSSPREAGTRSTGRASPPGSLGARADGIFCVNDRLAEALLGHARAAGSGLPAARRARQRAGRRGPAPHHDRDAVGRDDRCGRRHHPRAAGGSLRTGAPHHPHPAPRLPADGVKGPGKQATQPPPPVPGGWQAKGQSG